jgi:signal peptidase I, bacterial type
MDKSTDKALFERQLIDVLLVIIAAIITASVINGFVLTTVRVRGSSMDDTLYGGGDARVDNSATLFNNVFFGKNDSVVFGDKVVILRTERVKRGDIVVFKAYHADGTPYYETDQNGNKHGEQWIKRVIGVVGDTVRISGGNVYVNGECLDEPYLSEKGTTIVPGDADFQVTVGEGELFVLGDNRRNSTDSRRPEVGCIKAENLVGKVIVVIQKDERKLTFPKNLVAA